MSLARLYPSLASGPFRRLWIGIVPYHLCFQVGLVATGTAAIALAGSALEVGLILGAWGVPILFMPPFGGVAADRYSRRRTMLAAQVVLANLALPDACTTSEWNLMSRSATRFQRPVAAADHAR